MFSLSTTAVENDVQEEKVGSAFPFPVNANDHCESPFESYRDIAPLLELLSSSSRGSDNNNNNNKSSSSYRIYDPYYCNGAVQQHLSKLGFPNVYNVKQDCYQAWASGVGYPQHDIMVTNPPYSGNHIEKLLQHVTLLNYGPQRPWCLLLPTFVIKKEYYQSLVAKIRPFYLVPRKRYVYLPPKEYRTKRNSDVHKKSSSFISMWYIWGGSMERNEELIQHYLQQQQQQNDDDDDKTTHYYGCDLVRSKSALRDLRRRIQHRQSNTPSSSK